MIKSLNEFKFDSSIYIPAHTGLITTLINDEKHYANGKSLRYYNEGGVFPYLGFLISAGNNYTKKDMNSRLGVNLKNTLVLGDSGGYQIATGKLDIYKDPYYYEKIFYWLEDNTNYALNIDIPLYINVEKKSGGEFSFEDKINFSKINFNFFQKNQTGKTNYLNVLHGRTLEDLELWYDAVKDYNFKGGWALGSTNTSIFYILQSFFFAYRNGLIDKMKSQNLLHILGFSKVNYIPIIEYLQYKLNFLKKDIAISYDSSTPDIGAGKGQFIFNIDVNRINWINFNSKFNIEKDIPLPCTCPICNSLKYSDFYNNKNANGGFETRAYGHMILHNLYKILEYKDIVESMINSESKEFYSTAFPSYFIGIFEIIDDCFDHPTESQHILEMNRSFIMEKSKIKLDFDNRCKKKSFF